MKDALQKPMLRTVLALTACILWGSAIPCIKLGYGLFHMMQSPVGDKLIFAGLRFMMAGCLILVIFRLMTRRTVLPAKRNIPKILLLSSVQTVLQYVFYYIGLANAKGTTSSVITGSAILFSTCFAAIFFKKERLTKRKVLGCLIGFGGILIASADAGERQVSFAANGELMLLLTSVSFGLSTVISKWATADEAPFRVSGWQLLIGGRILCLIGTMAGGTVPQSDWRGWMMMGYLVLISTVAYILWTALLDVNPVTSVVIFYAVEPIVGVLLSATLLKEPLAWGKNTLGLVCVVLAIIIVNRPERRTAEAARD